MSRTVNKKFFIRLMEREGLNQKDLAKKLGKSCTTITNLMNGQPPKRAKGRKDIADAVAADIDFIFPEIGDDLAA